MSRRPRHAQGTGALVALLVFAASCTGGGDDATRPTTDSDGALSPITTTVPPPTTIPPPITTTTVPPLTFPPQEFVVGNVARPAATITFDCGASAAPTPAILDVLRRERIRTTFFLTGAWADQNPDLAKQIASEHEIANHTYTHGDLTTMTDAQVVGEMERGEAAIVSATGKGTKPLWRAPYGARNPRMLQLIADAGWSYHIFWTADALDWMPIEPAQVRANMNRGAVNGGIVLAHCGSPQTAEILATVIADFRAKGLTLTTVTEVLRG
jgi:peptidoglycan/xylan/chitin deacetylase (PgdA/CDA1 family)